ncbi:MAG: DUF4282 domain-containing protein [Nitrospinota bacterium]
MNQPKTFLASLFDFSFETFITARVVKVLYGLSIAAAALWALFLIVAGFRQSAGSGVLMLIVGGPLLFVIAVIYARVILEIVLVIFRISEHTSKMAGADGRTPAPPPSGPESQQPGEQWGGPSA